ncbi:MAG: TIGR02300 family protein [Deltaproteobacteria bacterium]|nr:MAG: TIGR02300 family protein [Deltaproteobacteria bacterium]
MPSKVDLGKRYTCFQCGKGFYDLNRPDPVCPKCGADQRDDPTPDPRVAVMSKYKTSSKPVKPTVSAAYDKDLDDDVEVVDDEVDVDVDDDDDDLPVDADI